MTPPPVAAETPGETPAEAHARAADPVDGWCQCHDGSPLCPHCDAVAMPDDAGWDWYAEQSGVRP